METPDLELVARCRDGDRDAYRLLVERYQRRVYGIAIGVLKNPEDAMDVTQDVFVKVYKNLGSFKGDSSFYTWLYRVCVNLCIDHVRKAKRARSVEYDDGIARDDGGEDAAPLVADTAHMHPGKAAERSQLRDAIAAALDQLSENHRTIIILREVEGLSYEEIAEAMECHVGTVMSRLHHARKNLQKALKPFLDETGNPLADTAGAGVRRS